MTQPKLAAGSERWDRSRFNLPPVSEPFRGGAKPEIAATAFLSMVVGGPLRAVVWGKAIEPAALEERIRFCVRLFLDGARPR